MRSIIAVMLSCVFLTTIYAQTEVPPGEVSGHWKEAGSPYRVTGDIHIPSDSTLQIDPGVTIEFQGYYELNVMGRLLALGTRTDTIRFTVNDTTGFSDPDTILGGWNGIRIQNIGYQNDSSKLLFCRLEYGKAVGNEGYEYCGGALCVVNFDKVKLANCLFEHNLAGGPDEYSPSGGALFLSGADILLISNTFRNNHAYNGGAILLYDSKAVFRDNMITHNRCTWDGGGVSCRGGSNPSFSGDHISHNHAGEMGGGITLWDADSAVLDRLTVTGNSANWGAGIGFLGCEAELSNTILSGNIATWLGGGIASDGSTITIRKSSFEGDSCTSSAGAIHIWQGTFHIRETSFTGNNADLAGAIHADYSKLLIEKSAFVSNKARLGGGMHAYNCHLKIDSCNFLMNEVSEDAAAISYDAGEPVFDTLFSVRITRSRFADNHAGRAAAGFSISQGHTMFPLVDVVIDRCTISDNRARQVAGFRIMRCIHHARVSNCIISGNLADAWSAGGAFNGGTVGELYNCSLFDNHSALVATAASTGAFGVSQGGRVNVFNCTFSGNSAGIGAGMQVYNGGEAHVANCIFWNNQPNQIGVSAVHDSLPCLISLQHNDIQYGPDSIRITDTVSTVIHGLGNMDKDPLFINAEEGDFRLQEGSPVIGAGIDSMEAKGNWIRCPDHDLDENPRPFPAWSKPDMGAFENQLGWPVGIGKEPKTDRQDVDLILFPNPFRTESVFEINLPVRCFVTLEFFNLYGSKVECPLSRRMETGIHRVIWKPESGEEGVYLYRFTAEGEDGLFHQESGMIYHIR